MTYSKRVFEKLLSKIAYSEAEIADIYEEIPIEDRASFALMAAFWERLGLVEDHLRIAFPLRVLEPPKQPPRGLPSFGWNGMSITSDSSVIKLPTAEALEDALDALIRYAITLLPKPE